ncbi:hypothetical protein [Enhygromyxa salina]|uniref:Uncharacterized protein n=1 Tax=Enhygromyxa salina TaxID=215803 RepID=A0A2S9YPG5_9BACT|nr:hypothetical protein [Enhygromyxa salina]PRQ06985.1 hypothetical protein ENSA7_33190 [Enhygromyxa salina]
MPVRRLLSSSIRPLETRPPWRPGGCSPCAALGLALAAVVLTLPLLESEPRDAASAASEAAAQVEDPLRGLWTRYESRGEGEPLRFWYFHGDGKGLYRYGKVGLANTHSFDYSVEPSGRDVDVSVQFRKRGVAHALTAVLEQDEHGVTLMTLRGDPYEPGARYRKVESNLDVANREPAAPTEQTSGIGDRLWIDYRNHATGGAEFHMYQLAATAIDGRGVGWFHRGDFDDWSTESLTYRLDGDRIELFFDVREEPNTTPFHVVDGDHGRTLVLDRDPRDFWATHRYRDGGRSFGGPAFALVAGSSTWPRPLSAP